MSERTLKSLAIQAMMLSVGGTANAQVILNEVFENPPNGGDGTWEYIEIHGQPGYNLTGYAVALVKGGEDEDGDDVPDGSMMQKGPEIDEAFTLDGWSIGPDGLFILYNREGFGFTGLEPFLDANPDFDFFSPESPSNPRFFNAASFQAASIPSVDVGGSLENDGSSTYMIIRRRPGHALTGAGASSYGPEYAWKKDVSPDVDFNSRLDFGDEHTLGNPVYYGEGLDGVQNTALMLEPVQVVDEVSWSNAGGKEYNLRGRKLLSNKISETPGFNPDCISRLYYYGANPLIGSTINPNDGDLDQRSLADESWVYGETMNIQPGLPDYTLFKNNMIEAGPDSTIGTADDELNWLAPTDPDGPTYSFDGFGDDNPDGGAVLRRVGSARSERDAPVRSLRHRRFQVYPDGLQ